MNISFLKYFCQLAQLCWLGCCIPILGSNLILEFKLKLCSHRTDRYISGCVTQLGKPEKCQHGLYSHLHWQEKSKDAVLGIGACLYYFTSRVCIENGWKQLCAKKSREELNVNFFLLIISCLCYCWVFHPCNCVNMYVLVRHLLTKLRWGFRCNTMPSIKEVNHQIRVSINRKGCKNK